MGLGKVAACSNRCRAALSRRRAADDLHGIIREVAGLLDRVERAFGST